MGGLSSTQTSRFRGYPTNVFQPSSERGATSSAIGQRQSAQSRLLSGLVTDDGAVFHHPVFLQGQPPAANFTPGLLRLQPHFRHDIKCPLCSKAVASDDIEFHLTLCMTKPRVAYNEDYLDETTDTECSICLENLLEGDHIARLPCLCIYHKPCIDEWFMRSQTCPEHPPQ